MSLLPLLTPAREVAKITSFLKTTLKSAKHSKLVIATSGGVDSSTALVLATKAIGPTNILALKLPYHSSHPDSLKLADLAIKLAKIPKRNHLQVNIGDTVDLIWKTILVHTSPSQTGNLKDTNLIRLGNIMARVRMAYLFDTAKAKQALVCGTENRSEELLGYFTRFGDEASDIEPLRHLYKTQLRQLGQYLKLPQPILDATPTAGLWTDQTDEAELGFSYELADQVLYLHFDKKMSPTQVTQKLSQTYPQKPKTHWQKLVSKVLSRVESSAFKHHLPYHL